MKRTLTFLFVPVVIMLISCATYANKDDYSRAIADCEAILRINPNHTNADRNIRIVRQQQG